MVIILVVRLWIRCIYSLAFSHFVAYKLRFSPPQGDPQQGLANENHRLLGKSPLGVESPWSNFHGPKPRCQWNLLDPATLGDPFHRLYHLQIFSDFEVETITRFGVPVLSTLGCFPERYTSQCDFVNRPVLSISFSMAWFDLIYKGVPSITPWITITVLNRSYWTTIQ